MLPQPDLVGAGHARENKNNLKRKDRHMDTKGLEDGSTFPGQRNGPGHRALRRGRVSIPNHVYLVTASTLNRECRFLDFQAGCAAARCFGDPGVIGDARMLAWVLMPDHAHWLIQLGRRDGLSVVANRLKSASARRVNRVEGRCGALWMRGYHDHALRSEEGFREVARYITANPVRAGLVKRVGDYPFWDAVWV